MAQPGNVIHRVFRVRSLTTGAPVTGLTLGSFTVSAWTRPYGGAGWSAWLPSTAITELGGGDYGITYTLPAAAGFHSLRLDSSGRAIAPTGFEGETENQDLDSIYRNTQVAAVQTAGQATLGLSYPNALVAYRYAPWEISILDQSGAAVDLTAYTNLRLAVRSKDQVTRKLDATNGAGGFTITGDAFGTLTVIWPESTGAGAADIYAHLPLGAESAEPLYYEITGDLGGDAAKTVPIIRSSQLTILRREFGS